MATIDDKVVAMSFESSRFEAGVNRSISALDKLKAALHLPNAGKALMDVDAAAKRVNLSHISEGVQKVSRALESLRLIAIGVMSQLATQAIRAGGRFVKAFTLDPLKAGFSEYTTNLNAVQTILANTQAAGTKLKDVNAALKELNEYSDKTIYNFSQMAKNIGTFTAAGVDLDTATGAIKGIANLAALSGSNAEQASTAMYQLSQAISAGRVSLQDWNSVVNAGMGGTVFQRALAQTAEAMGTLKEGTVKLTGPMKNVSIAGESFRQSLQAGPGKASWLTSEVLTKTLSQFTGDLTKAELAAMGFNEAQIKAIQTTATTAMKAATEVKTLEGVLTTAKETAGSGWAQTWQIIFGDFGEAKELFTGVSNAVNGFISASADARNKVLGDWKALGGRTLLIDSVRTAFQNLGKILAPIKQAFRDIFPPVTGKNLYDLTLRFKEFAEALKPSATTVDGLRRTFRGFFALLSIGKQLISGIFTVFAQLFGAVGEGSGSFLNFTGSIGDFLVSVDKALKEGNRLHNFFVTIGQILRKPIELLGQLGNALSNLFGGFSSGGFSDSMGGLTKAMTPFEKVLTAITAAWLNFMDAVGNAGSVLKPVFEAFTQMLTGLGVALGNAASNINFEAILAVIRTGLLVGLTVMFKKFLGKGSLIEQIGGAGGIFGNISGAFSALEKSMVGLQNNIKAKTLKEIAIAIALLTASVVALSFVDPERLKSSLTAMTVAFGQLLGAMAILGNISKSLGFIKMPVIAAALILLAGAIDLLTIAVMAMAQLSWSELARGLGGVAALLGAVSAAVIPLSANSAGMIRAGIGITALAIALNLLALAVRQMASMSWTELGKGLGAVAIGLGIMAGAMRLMPTASMVIAGAGLIAVATGLNILAFAIEKLGGMDWRVLGKGLAAVAASLVGIALAMKLMPKSIVITAAGLLLVAIALQGIARAVEKMGGMSVREIAKGLGTLAGSLIILAVALHAMSGAIGGAVALGIAAAGLALLAPALVALGKQSWGEILKGLITLAAALTILGIAGLLIEPVVPALLGLGAALLLIGGGLALAGAGVALIGVGLSAIAVAGPTAVGIMVAAMTTFTEGVIKNAKLIILGLLEIVEALADAAPQFVDALVKILNSLLDVIIKSGPKIGDAINALIKIILDVFNTNRGSIIQAGMNLIIDLLKGIRNNIGQVVTIVVDIVVKFLNSLSNNMNRIVAAGANVLLALLRGIANNLANVVGAVGDIITKFVGAIASNLGRIATAGLTILTRLLNAIAARLGDVIQAGVNLIVAFVTGIGNAAGRIVTAARESAGKFINTLARQIVALADEVFNALITLINGMANTINTRAPELRSAGMNLGFAIINGMTFGLAGAAQGLYNKASEIAGKALSILKAPWKALSPSRTMMELGENIILGMSKGLDDNAPDVYSSAEALSNGVIKKFNDVFQTASPSKVMHEIGQFVGQGFANGLKSSGEDINEAFTDLNEKLTDAMLKARETIASEQEKLDKLRAAKKPDAKAIAEAQKVIKENEALLARSTAGHILLTKTLRDEKAELIGLANDYEKIGEKLKKAQEVLSQAQKTREDAIKSFTDQYSTLPEIVKEDAEGNAIDQLATYMEALKHQADAVGAYQSTLDQLRKLGLDDATYQKLLKEGTADQQFATQLLSGGKTAVQALNTLDANLMKVSKTLAVNAGNNLYQAGVDAAAGLVKGLKSKQSDIRETMEEIAREMIRALKKELKIKSPSEAFAEIGVYSMEGMAKGFASSSQMLEDAVDKAGRDALAAMKSSMSRITQAVAEEIDPKPVITPILDLTTVRAQAEELTALTSTTPLTAAASYNQASLISSEQRAAQTEEVAAVAGGTSVKFEQNNYSPEALSEVEIYRQTRNQLSQLKSALAVT